MALGGGGVDGGSLSLSAAGCQALFHTPTASCFLSLQEVALRSLPVGGAAGDGNGERGDLLRQQLAMMFGETA